jgi:hypothetical protein
MLQFVKKRSLYEVRVACAIMIMAVMLLGIYLTAHTTGTVAPKVTIIALGILIGLLLHFQIKEQKQLLGSPRLTLLVSSGHDPRVDRAIAVLNTGEQRQDSTTDQLNDVLAMAVAAGCYDAHELIKRALNK